MLRALIITYLIIFILPALGRDDGRYADSPLKPWFENLKNGHGNPCCDGSDGQRVEDPDWEMRESGYRVRLHGQWINVDPMLVVTTRNIVGVAMVWPYVENGITKIRCFMPGAGG